MVREQGGWPTKLLQLVPERRCGHAQQLIRHHNNGKEPWDFPMSLAHQAARQDPGMYLIAVAFLGNSLVAAVPFLGEDSLFVELAPIFRIPYTPHSGSLYIMAPPTSEITFDSLSQR